MALDGLIYLWVQNNAENIRNRNQLRISQRHLRDTSNPFSLPFQLFLKLFRLSKPSCHDFIQNLTPHMHRSRRNTRIPIHLRILSTLHFLGQGSYQGGIGHGYCLGQSQPSISRCISEVTDIIARHFVHIWIKFPTDDIKKREVKRAFVQQGAIFEDVLGIVDCTHVKIIAPPENHPIYPGGPYYCRKGYYSINTQIITDGNKQIININARFPGSVHDSAIWSMSNIKTYLQQQYVLNNRQCNYLIGDSGYPLQPWLITPYQHVLRDSPEARFNDSLSRLRTTIEHVNGLLKSRFRCLHGHRALNYNPRRVANIIYSFAVLHNICRQHNVPLPQDEEILEPLPPPPQVLENPNNLIQDDWFLEGRRVRQRLINRYFN